MHANTMCIYYYGCYCIEMHLFNMFCIQYIILVSFWLVKNTMVTDAHTHTHTQYLLTYKKGTRAPEDMSYYFGTSINGLGSS